MKKITYLFILCVLSLWTMTSCNENDDFNNQQTTIQEDAGYQKAANLVYEFSEKINNAQGTTRTNASTLRLSLSNTKTITIDSPNTRNGYVQPDSVNLYIFNTEKDGKLGFAIATGDEETGQVYAYVENGSLADTIQNESMAYVVRQIPDIIKENQLQKGITRASNGPRYTHVTVPLVKTEWNQYAPYNAQMPTNGACSGSSYYLAGCPTIAIAQAISYYRKCPTAYDWDAITSSPQIYSGSSLAEPVSRFVKQIADGIHVSYRCDGTGVKNLGSTYDFLKSWGYNIERHKTSDVNKDLLFLSLVGRNVVIFSGYKKKGGGHAWLVDGGVFEYSKPSPAMFTDVSVIAVHCNFGWINRSNNGWYAVKNTAYNKPVNNASKDGNNPSDGSNSIADYYRENDYVYFREQRGGEIL